MFNRAHASHRNQFGRFNTYGTILDPSDIFWDDWQPSARMAMDDTIYKLFNKEKIDYIRNNPQEREDWDDSIIGDLVGILPGQQNSKGYGMGRKQVPLPLTEEEALKAEIAQAEAFQKNGEFVVNPNDLSDEELTTINTLLNQPGISDSNPIIAAASLAVLKRMNSQGISSLGHIGTNAGGRRRDTSKDPNQKISDAIDIVQEMVSGRSKAHGGVNAGIETNISHNVPVNKRQSLSDARSNYNIGSAELNQALSDASGHDKLQKVEAFREMKMRELAALQGKNVQQDAGRDAINIEYPDININNYHLNKDNAWTNTGGVGRSGCGT